MRFLRPLCLTVLVILAVAGCLISLVFVGVSFMGFDAPGSDRQFWPYALVFTACVTLLASALFLVIGLRSIAINRPRLAFICLSIPAAVAIVFLSLANS